MDPTARSRSHTTTATARWALVLHASRITRALFYAVTVGAALAAVVATNASDGTGPWLSEWSWYLLMSGLLLFALMVVLQAWLAVRSDDG
ncbi:MAG: hypothetical protein KA795_03985 [Burkholderiaceae bacterium]|nr:hypothetical protein [Burkholderiaceae bacterium]